MSFCGATLRDRAETLACQRRNRRVIWWHSFRSEAEALKAVALEEQATAANLSFEGGFVSSDVDDYLEATEEQAFGVEGHVL